MRSRTPLPDLHRVARVGHVDDPEVTARHRVEPLGEGGREQRVHVATALEQIELVHAAATMGDAEEAQMLRVIGVSDVPEVGAELSPV